MKRQLRGLYSPGRGQRKELLDNFRNRMSIKYDNKFNFLLVMALSIRRLGMDSLWKKNRDIEINQNTRNNYKVRPKHFISVITGLIFGFVLFNARPAFATPTNYTFLPNTTTIIDGQVVGIYGNFTADVATNALTNINVYLGLSRIGLDPGNPFGPGGLYGSAMTLDILPGQPHAGESISLLFSSTLDGVRANLISANYNSYVEQYYDSAPTGGVYVPEPSSLALLLTALVGLSLTLRSNKNWRRKKA